MIYCAINDNGTWRTSYNSELYTVYDKPDSQSDKNRKNEVARTPL